MDGIKTRVCKKCKTEYPAAMLRKNYDICPGCGTYMRVHAKRRIDYLADEQKFTEWDKDLYMYNPLEDEGYADSIIATREKNHLNEAVLTGEITICGYEVAIGVMDTRFMMGSMGHIVGEKVTRLFETATRKKLPVILFCCSGGARMQEGIISLMQMEKTAAAVKRHSEEGLLYVSVLTNPTMGGVTASFATIADVVLAEKNAMIGFAGPRVIEQNTGEKLPGGFQSAEFQMEHGFVDRVVERQDLRQELAFLLSIHEKKSSFFKRRFRLFYEIKDGKITERTPWERVQIARSKERPTSLDYINTLFESFYELKGDRVKEDDHAVIGGVARFRGMPVTVIGTQKGKNSLEEAMYYNWGMPLPSGYRKALRLAKEAEKFHRPIVFFVDTIGASCGKKAEEEGQGQIIANVLQEMSVLKVPTLSVVIGEGGSGGALALGIGNEVWMLENSVYSVLTPEGYASILWKDNNKAADAAKKMKLEAKDLYDLGVIDKIIYEKEPVTTENMDDVCSQLRAGITEFFDKHASGDVAAMRYKRFRKY
ncbi:acetyl-CoA carboxylase carboxyltransferase subunit alpha/beta [Butyrivibrio sp. YAB3001]|uniref:acetyl-CoA carboxylase carboxyltransferase subunit alpha/beta n=1 Tax=Butyrivibrio sp. YAB3001 TaxID=1520812 RepID=UPI0008F634A6|nr:acetyl-CoA carboxylase carboxyltransferase subunit alpha/beta [Butyrivibrio sp. YAB3001]SFC13135.1 acetyl-CoA carboxylase carboxyl transferase subunit beta [Butyrivibrio sp. YAB3001]